MEDHWELEYETIVNRVTSILGSNGLSVTATINKYL